MRLDASEFSQKPFLLTAVMVITCVMPFCASTGLGQILPNSPAPQWVTVLFGNNNFPDPSSDQ